MVKENSIVMRIKVELPVVDLLVLLALVKLGKLLFIDLLLLLFFLLLLRVESGFEGHHEILGFRGCVLLLGPFFEFSLSIDSFH